jgi:long-subunit fatty acid transport protein
MHVTPDGREPILYSSPPGFLENLYWGVSLNIPVKRGAHLDLTSDTTQPRWFQYGPTLEKIGISAGVGFLVFDGLSLGASIGLASLTEGALRNDLVAFSTTLSNISFQQEVTAPPTFRGGLLFTPWEGLDLGVVYRTEISDSIEQETVSDIRVLAFPTATGILVEGTSSFTPQQVALGVRYTPLPLASLEVEATWNDWSAYPGPYLLLTLRPTTTSGVTLVPQEDPEFDNTLSWRTGVELTPWDSWTFRAGYGLIPSPAPDQSGATNILGSDTQILSIGAEWRFFPTASLQAFGQWHLLEEQEVTESITTRTPPAWSAENSVFSAGAGIQWKF